MNNKNNYHEQLLWTKQRKVKVICTKLLLFKNVKAKSKEYYENNTERLQKQAQNSHQNPSKEEKDQKIECREYGTNRYKNIPKENEEKLKEYGKRYHIV